MRDLGDFQTPPALVAAVLDRLGAGGGRWARVLEPTCGRGHFLAGLLALDVPPREILGVEIQPGHLEAARAVARRAPGSVRVGLTGGSLFSLDLAAGLDWRERGPLLVVGNPPWVTNAALGAMGSAHRPPRSNVKGVRGIDAITGSSNFDVAEAVWLKLLTELAAEEPTIALLCKTAVARNVLEHAARTEMPVARAAIVRVDARAWFGAAVEACLLCVRVGRGGGLDRVPVFDGLDAAEPARVMGLARGRLVDDLDAYADFAFADGECPLVWRQGLKHDAAGVMELIEDERGGLSNRLGEPADVERSHVYPLLKGSDLARPGPASPSRRVIVTQRAVGDDTGRLRAEAPRLWDYLERYADRFAARRSSVYRGRPPFAMFGVGPYSFSAFKVAVSGLGRTPVFHAVGPWEGRPVMLDDTGYFLACRSPEQAALASALLNGRESLGLLAALTCPGGKRPVTKALLRRLDLPALLARAETAPLLARAAADVKRLAGRPPAWPPRLETLLEPEDEAVAAARRVDGLSSP
jgi:hypothetical protein